MRITGHDVIKPMYRFPINVLRLSIFKDVRTINCLCFYYTCLNKNSVLILSRTITMVIYLAIKHTDYLLPRVAYLSWVAIESE